MTSLREREAHCDDCALPELALQIDRTAVRIDDLARDGQAKPGAAEQARPRLVHTIEPVKQPRDVGSSDADAVVSNFEDRILIVAPRSQGDRPTVGCVLHRVVEEDEDDLVAALRIRLYGQDV